MLESASGGAPAPSGSAAAHPDGAAPPPTDPPVETPEAPPEDPLNRKFLRAQEQIKRQERELRKRDARMKELEERAKLVDLMEKDPLEALKAKGHTYDDLTRRVLEQTQVTPEEAERMSLKQKVEALEAERQREREEASQRESQAARQRNLDAITAHLEENDELAYTAALGLSGELLSRLEAWASENGTAPSPEEQAEVAMALEKDARDHATKSIGVLLKRSPAFREQLRKDLAGYDETTTPSQHATEATRKGNPAPRTVTREQLSAVESRVDQSALTLEERKRRGRERALARIERENA